MVNLLSSSQFCYKPKTTKKINLYSSSFIQTLKYILKFMLSMYIISTIFNKKVDLSVIGELYIKMNYVSRITYVVSSERNENV